MLETHRPPHNFGITNTYFVTGKTLHGVSFFDSDPRRQIAMDTLRTCSAKHSLSLHAFVIHPNHYHLLFSLRDATVLPFFIRDLHANSSRAINALDLEHGRRVWYQYWDRGIRTERDFWQRFNYIHHNPVKHGYLAAQDELDRYPWCSYRLWLGTHGKAWLDSTMEKFPIKDFTLELED